MLAPDRADWYSNLAIVLRDLLRLDDAVTACRHAIAIDPDHANAHSNLGVLLKTQGTRRRSGSGVSRGHPLQSLSYRRLHEPGYPPQQPEPDLRSRRLFLPGDALCGRNTRTRGGCWRWRTVTLGEIDQAVAILDEWLREEPGHPIARHLLAACSGRDVPSRASDAFIETTFDNFAGSFDAKLAQLQDPAPALVAAMLDEPAAGRPGTLDMLDAGCGTGLCGPLIASAPVGWSVSISPGACWRRPRPGRSTTSSSKSR